MVTPQQDEAKKFSETFRYGRLRLRKYAVSGVWQAKFRNLKTGKWVERSLGTTLKRDALRNADQLNTQITNQTLGVADGTFPIQRLFDEFFRAKQGRRKPETVKRVMSSRHMFERWLLGFHPEARLVKHVTKAIVREFQEHRVEVERVEETTADNDIKNLHTVFRWGEKEGYVASSPFNYSREGNIDLYDPPKADLDTYSEDEYIQLLAAAEEAKDSLIRDAIIVLAGTGMRFNEMAHLRPNALHWDAEIPFIEIRARRKAKRSGNRKSRRWSPKGKHEVKYIPMMREVQEVLRRCERECGGGYLFQNGNGNLIANNHTRERLQRLFPKAGIIDADRRLHWHSFRNYFIERCLDKHIAVHRIMQWTGHDCVSLVLHYAGARTNDKVGFEDFKRML